MAWAQEMKNLVADIQTSHKDRTDRIGEIKTETRDILGKADDYMKSVAAELKEMAKDLKNFLAKNEETRKKDFNATMEGIRAKIKEIRGDVKDLLIKSEEQRITDFKVLMKDIKEDIGAVKKAVADILESTKDLLGSYATEKKEAARYWASLKAKGEVGVAPAVAEKRGRPKGKK